MTWNSMAPLNGQGAKLCQYVSLCVCVYVSQTTRVSQAKRVYIDTGNKIDYACAHWRNETSRLNQNL